MIYLQRRLNKLTEDKENLFFLIWLLFMAVYYGVRMFTLTPWYDELYTYYYFISRGPVYAAIHWPLPNNHVGYSVLSGFLDLLGNPAIGLRGVSYLCALGNLILLYRICRRSFHKGWSLACIFLYSGMNLVNQLALQGRGYTLTTFCYLLAIHMLQYICMEDKEKPGKYYIIFSLSLTLALYSIPSSVYFVAPVCLIGGIFLLMYKEKKKLIRLVMSSVIAAGNTVFLYMVIWLAIGSNLLSKMESSKYFGMGHVEIICSAPFKAMHIGVKYMLATPYIQSIERDGFLGKLRDWILALFDYFYSNAGRLLFVVIGAGIIILCIKGYRQYKAGEREKFFLALYMTVTFLLVPVCLIIQSILPYYRVFSYMGAAMAMCICVLLQMTVDLPVFQKVQKNIRFFLPMAVTFLLTVVLLLSKDYNKEYGMSEYYALNAYEQADVANRQNICVTDCYQQYILKYYWDIECENQQIQEADCVLLHKDMLDKEFEGFRWEFYHHYDTVPWEYIENNMTLAYENEEYVLYIKE